jgi:hypothetical protein
MNRNWSLLGLFAFMAFAPGCGPSIQTLCEDQEKCLGGNDADIDACVAAYDGTRDGAYDIGCGDEYDALINCVMPQYSCNDGAACATSDECKGSACVKGMCHQYGLDNTNADACQTEVNAYSRCD